MSFGDYHENCDHHSIVNHCLWYLLCSQWRKRRFHVVLVIRCESIMATMFFILFALSLLGIVSVLEGWKLRFILAMSGIIITFLVYTFGG